MGHCQLVLFDPPPMKIKDIYREIFHNDIAAQELVKRGVGDRISGGGPPHWVWVCGSSRQPTPQCRCGRWASQLCDESIGNGKTCDIPLCGHCTVRPYPGEDIDLCHLHALRRDEPQQGRLL